MPDMRYSCSMLRAFNWFKRTPYGWCPFHKYFWKDTLNHINLWYRTGQYDYWNVPGYWKTIKK